MKMNNSLPEALTDLDDDAAPLVPLRVMTKLKWLEWKIKLKKISKEILERQGNQKNLSQKGKILVKGSVLKFRIFQKPTLNKTDVKLAIMHMVEPAYVDYLQNNHTGFVRFFGVEGKNDFLSKLGGEKFMMIKEEKVCFEELDQDEEDEYFGKVEQKRKRFKKVGKLGNLN